MPRPTLTRRRSLRASPHRRAAPAVRWTLCITLLLTPAARAETPLDEQQTAGYYLARGGAVAGALGLAFATAATFHPVRPEPTPSEWLGWDDTVRGRLSTEASTTSDVTLVTTLGVPIGAELTQGVDTRLANTSIIYAEIVAANFLLNTVVKYTVPRLRPYNYRAPPATVYVESQGVDAQLSFYSGHASSAFAAAIGGSYLFAAANPEGMAKSYLWGVESAMATATAILRIRAGKHFYSDVAVGMVVGSAMGIGVPLLEGVRYRPTATEMAFAGGGALIGGLAAVVVPFEEDAAVVLGATRLRVQVVPAFSGRAAGVSAMGSF